MIKGKPGYIYSICENDGEEIIVQPSNQATPLFLLPTTLPPLSPNDPDALFGTPLLVTLFASPLFFLPYGKSFFPSTLLRNVGERASPNLYSPQVWARTCLGRCLNSGDQQRTYHYSHSFAED